MDKYELPPDEELIADDVTTSHKIKICSFDDACKLKPNMVYKTGLMIYGITKYWDGWGRMERCRLFRCIYSHL